ncbi:MULTISPECIES: DUF2269 family protein [Cryobacterium]|uniref:DUF2269 family protein n=1 Tax=Cryobacterium breve TaxID=1259258 RepID=A0ABY2IYY0_9MICO|nr:MULTISPECIES: DUF2269 family protein [Cryobacterium]TFC93093.1 DUF2269 family protein [Cryobacterium sp. TmT3-12]TFC96078.1 DUF2269 family protein [Cryobacterium breve]
MEPLLSTLHIVTGVFIVGPMAIMPMSAMRSMRAGEAGQVASIAKSTNIFTLLSLLVALLGFGALGFRDNVSFASTWIWLSIVLYAASVAVSLFVVIPAMKSVSEILAEQSAGGTRVAGVKVAGYSRVAMGSGIASLLLVVVVVLMVLKPL